MNDRMIFTPDESVNILDITDFRQQGPALQQAIYDAVKDTQSVVIQQLPNVLEMTVAQYKMLDPYGDMVGAYNSKQRVFVTPYNAMDVVVKDTYNLDPSQAEANTLNS